MGYMFLLGLASGYGLFTEDGKKIVKGYMKLSDKAVNKGLKIGKDIIKKANAIDNVEKDTKVGDSDVEKL